MQSDTGLQIGAVIAGLWSQTQSHLRLTDKHPGLHLGIKGLSLGIGL